MKELEKITKSLKIICRIASRYGIADVLKPGILKRIVVANHFGHEPVFEKGFHAQDEEGRYYYLTAWDRNRFQTGMIVKEDIDLMEADFFCFVVFDSRSQAQILRAYKVPRDKFLAETIRQISGNKKKRVHVSFTEKWVKRNS